MAQLVTFALVSTQKAGVTMQTFERPLIKVATNVNQYMISPFVVLLAVHHIAPEFFNKRSS